MSEDNELAGLLGNILGGSEESEPTPAPTPAPKPKQKPKQKPKPAPKTKYRADAKKVLELENLLHEALYKIKDLEKKSKRDDNIFEIVKQSYETIYNSNITRYTNAKATGMLNSLKIVKSYFDN